MLFEGMVQGFADLIGTSLADAGLILGLILVTTLILAPMVLLRKSELELGLMMGGAGVAFTAGIGWWEPWTVIFIVLIVVLLIIKPFGLGSSSGGR